MFVTWRIEDGQCRLVWREADGPPVVSPTRRGLGSRLLRAQAGLAAVRLEFQAAGVVCEIAVEGAVSAAA